MVQARQEQPQITAYISKGTKARLDKLMRARGLRKGFVLEQALQYYFRSLEELPEEIFLPPRLVLSQEAFGRVLDMINNPAEPTQAMLELMRVDPDSSPEES